MKEMNKKGSVQLLGLMLGMVIVVMALALAGPLQEVNSVARSGYDCGNSSISNFDKGACLITDLTMPYYIWALLLLAIVIMGAKFVFG